MQTTVASVEHLFRPDQDCIFVLYLVQAVFKDILVEWIEEIISHSDTSLLSITYEQLKMLTVAHYVTPNHPRPRN